MVDTSAIQWLLADYRTSERGLWRNKIPDRARSGNTESRIWNRPQQWPLTWQYGKGHESRKRELEQVDQFAYFGAVLFIIYQRRIVSQRYSIELGKRPQCQQD